MSSPGWRGPFHPLAFHPSKNLAGGAPWRKDLCRKAGGRVVTPGGGDGWERLYDGVLLEDLLSGKGGLKWPG